MFDRADAEAVEFFRTNGWVMTRTLDDAGAERLRAWVDEIMAWPDDTGNWIHYREMTENGPRLCRTENFVPYHEGIRALLTEGPMIEAASALLVRIRATAPRRCRRVPLSFLFIRGRRSLRVGPYPTDDRSWCKGDGRDSRYPFH